MKVLIPMAGAGSRFQKVGYHMPKPLISVANKTLIEHSICSFDIPAQFIFITRKFENPDHNQQLSTLLKLLRPESIEIQLDVLTNGASETCLAAKEYINNNEPLVIYNCDQIFNWDPQEFLNFIHKRTPDGAVVLYKNRDPKNSFADVRNGEVRQLVEKQVISDHALVGFHYWAQGKDFVQSAQQLVDKFHLSGKPECYVSETYNYLISQGKTILPFHISNNKFIPLGTPEDVNRYLGKLQEFTHNKPKTIFCDVDGTILKHAHVISEVLMGQAQVLDQVREKFNQWDSAGHKIILVTARKESARQITELHLQQLGIAYDHLLMGITSGCRVLINDKLTDLDVDRAVAVNVITDEGFGHVDWKGTGL
jgi:dTDP-glucose pyrophosphorylase